MKGQAQKVSGEPWKPPASLPPQRAFDFLRLPPRYGKTFAGRSWHCWRRGEERKEGKIEREGGMEPLPLPEIKLSPSWRFFMSAAGLICHMSQEST